MQRRKGCVDDHNSLIYKQIPANLWTARNDAIEQLRAKAGYIDQTQEETHQSIKINYQYINEIQ
jgi:hypothetical protein